MTSYDEYTLRKQMMAAQNMQNSISGLGQYSQPRQNPLAGYDIRSTPLDELEQMIAFLAKEYDRRTMDTPLTGPTRRQLLEDVTLKEAWDQFEVLRKLKGK